MKEFYKAKDYYQRKDVAESYDLIRFTGKKGWVIDFLEKRALRKALAETLPGSRILDLPVGTGRMMRLLLARGFWAVGADISSEMLKRIINGQDNSRHSLFIVQADSELLPFKTNSFDYIVSFRFFPHLPPDVRKNILKEMIRISRKGIVINYYLKNNNLLWCFDRIIRPSKMPGFPISKRELQKEFKIVKLGLIKTIPLLRGILASNLFLLEPK